MFYWEVVLFIVILVFLGSGIVRLAMKRQTEILKDYLLPRDTPLMRTILRPGKNQFMSKKSENRENPPEAQTEEQSDVAGQEEGQSTDSRTTTTTEAPAEQYDATQSVP